MLAQGQISLDLSKNPLRIDWYAENPITDERLGVTMRGIMEFVDDDTLRIGMSDFDEQRPTETPIMLRRRGAKSQDQPAFADPKRLLTPLPTESEPSPPGLTVPEEFSEPRWWRNRKGERTVQARLVRIEESSHGQIFAVLEDYRGGVRKFDTRHFDVSGSAFVKRILKKIKPEQPSIP